MFSSKLNKLDMFEAIQGGKVVLVNTSKALLKSDASALFGRYMIALASKPPSSGSRRKTADRPSCSSTRPRNISTTTSRRCCLTGRKFNLGIVIAHQHLDQLSTALRSSVAANTSIKLAGGVSDRDARTLAPDMRTDPDFITSMAKNIALNRVRLLRPQLHRQCNTPSNSIPAPLSYSDEQRSWRSPKPGATVGN